MFTRPSASNAPVLEEITTADALAGAAPEWRSLWCRCRDATPFQSPEWLLPWWECFGTGELHVLAFRSQDRLVALLPIYAAQAGDDRSRVLRLLGSGVSDYLDILVEPGFAEGVMCRFFRWLQKRREGWDRCDFLELRPGSPLLDYPAPAGWDDEIGEAAACAVATLRPGDADAAIPQHFLKKLCYQRRRAARVAALRIEQADEAGFEPAFDALLRLHAARWTARGQPGVLAGAAVQAFHRRAARGLLQLGLLRLYTLFLDERPAASCYVFLHRECAYFYLSGFDPAFATFSPGHLLLHHAFRQAAREGARRLDFLRGREQYKSRWCAEERRNRRRRLRRSAGRRELQRHSFHPTPKHSHETLQDRPR